MHLLHVCITNFIPCSKVVMNLTLKKKGPSEENFGIKIWNGTIIEFLLLKTVDLNETKRAVTNDLKPSSLQIDKKMFVVIIIELTIADKGYLPTSSLGT